MSPIATSVVIDAPVERVWEAVADLASHSQWMTDAESVEILDGPKEGVGTRIEVRTKVGPLRTLDRMEVVEWTEERSIGVRHCGFVGGEGSFRLSPVAGGTRFTWTEHLSFPWYVGGPLLGFLTRPVLAWVWRRNLGGLKERLER